jgi:hypothetical protein
MMAERLAIANITLYTNSDWANIDVVSGGSFTNIISQRETCGDGGKELDCFPAHLIFKRPGCNLNASNEMVLVLGFQPDGSLIHFKVNGSLADAIRLKTTNAWCGSIAGGTSDVYIDPAAL